jgi:4-amino-4-deoxy-L-arabinose transferase-like glycosyltransferase
MNGRRLQIWRSPAGQPAWARPALLVITAAATFSYAWQADRPVNIEIYYAAAVRSMSMSFRNFVFGAFDPAGTISTDKLPGAFWLQALSVRLFGVHNWALVLPQVIEGGLTVLVLYRVLRKLAGPAAGLLAAAVLAVSPATVALDRGNVSDTLMILLAVLAADAAVTAVTTGRRGPILLAGLWVGLAFQAKMIEAWLVLPAICACYLLAAPGGWRQRAGRAGAMLGVAVGVSLSWMLLVTAWPASQRPYIDGSHDNSVFQQVFVYNGFGRLDQASPDQLLNHSIGLGLPASPPPAWDRLLTGHTGLDTGWLLGVALITAVAVLLARRSQPRGDLIRAGVVLWGGWLLVLAVVFSISSTLNDYYTAALSPAVAALIGIGISQAWQHRRRLAALLAVAAGLVASCCYAAWLLPAHGVGLPDWLKPAMAGLGIAAALGLGWLALESPWRSDPPGRPRLGRSNAPAAAAAVALGLSAVASLIVPAVAAASVPASGLGPFQTPFESQQGVIAATRFFGAGFAVARALPVLEAGNRGKPYLMATQTSVLAAPFIYASGREVLPIGGFTGTIPSPTLNAIKTMIQLGDVSTFIQSPTTSDPRLTWIASHCFPVTRRQGPAPVLPVSIYYCTGAIFLR